MQARYNALSIITIFGKNMLKLIHLGFILISLGSFIGRVILSEINPVALDHKMIKIAPHIINFILIISGVSLVFQGNWLSMDFGWIIAKLLVLFVYIGLGIMTLRLNGQNKWLAFSGAMLCLAYIGVVAVTKDAFFFL